MTIQEAIKSGKRFRRKGMAGWCKENNTFVDFAHDCNDSVYEGFIWSVGHILADDWEIEEKEYIIKKSDFYHALSEARKEVASNNRFMSEGFSQTEFTETIHLLMNGLFKDE